MNVENVMTFACAAFAILVLIAGAVVFLLTRSAIGYSKRTDANNTSLSITAKRNLDRITVLARFNNEEMAFERKRIRKGQTIDFVYPATKQKAKLTLVGESGNVQVLEV